MQKAVLGWPRAPTPPTPVCINVVRSFQLAASGWCEGGRGCRPDVSSHVKFTICHPSGEGIGNRQRGEA